MSLGPLLVLAALAHPHPGGIVARADGTVIVGDILRPRLLAIAPSGVWREIPGVGHVRDLELAADGTLHGVSQGSGLWTLGADERPSPLLADFHGLFALGEGGILFLAPADAHDRRPRLEMRSPDSRRSPLAALGQIEALARHGGAVAVADGSAIRIVEPEGAIRTLTERAGDGICGLTIGPDGLIAAAFEDREVIEISADGSRRVLLVSEPPWGPTDAVMHGGVLYALEYAFHPCCWKGPRVRRIAPGEPPATLLLIDDGDHDHPNLWLRLALYILAGAGIIAALVSALVWALRRRARRGRSAPGSGPAPVESRA